jgi:metal-responsive CopG/Arc/MetJ family transcriptional regulator
MQLVSQRPTCIYLPADLRELVDRIAATSNVSRSAVIQGAIRKALAEPMKNEKETNQHE